MQRVLEERGIETDCEHGTTDDGVPWISFHDVRDGSLVAHVAREPGTYMLICSDNTVERSPVLSQLLRTVRDKCQHEPYAANSVSGVSYD